MWRSCTFRNITDGYRSSTSWACTYLCARDWSREVIWLTWYYLMRATFAVQNSTRWTFGRGVISPYSTLEVRLANDLSHLLDAHSSFQNYSRSYLSSEGEGRTLNQREEGGTLIRNTVNYQHRNGRERTTRWFFGGKKRPNSLRTCEISCLCFNFVVFILFSAHSVWSHLP